MKKVDLKQDKQKEGRVFIHCPFCEEKISGTSRNHLITNLKMHLMTKHPNEEKVEINE